MKTYTVLKEKGYLSAMSARIELPDAPPIPGLRFRQFDAEVDYPAMRAMHEASSLESWEEPEAVTTRSQHRHSGHNSTDEIEQVISGS